MLTSNHLGRRLAALTTICASLALGTAATVAAYPITPEGEPLHLNTGAATSPQPAVVPGASDNTIRAGETAPIPANAVPLADISNDGTDWIETARTVIASLAVLALAVAALTMTGHLRGSARTD